jgi:hypothetical protein
MQFFCSVKFHVVCTCDTICLLTNRKMIKIATLIDWLIDWLIYILYWVDIWLLTSLSVSLQYLSESCFENDNNLLLPNSWVVLFIIYPTFYSLKILCTQPLFSSVPPPPLDAVFFMPNSYLIQFEPNSTFFFNEHYHISMFAIVLVFWHGTLKPTSKFSCRTCAVNSIRTIISAITAAILDTSRLTVLQNINITQCVLSLRNWIKHWSLC